MFPFSHKKVRGNQTLPSIHPLVFNSLQGESYSLEQFKGKYLLLVNVASKCGFTPQYEELQQLHTQFKDQLTIIGFPCNQFGNQEPGSAVEIASFCSLNCGVSFLIAEKLDVKDENQHPIYSWLTKKEENGVASSSVKWNFQKYLIDPEGYYLDVFYSLTKPMSEKILKYLNN